MRTPIAQRCPRSSALSAVGRPLELDHHPAQRGDAGMKLLPALQLLVRLVPTETIALREFLASRACPEKPGKIGDLQAVVHARTGQTDGRKSLP